MSDEPIPPGLTPLVLRDGNWFLSCPPKSTLLCGRIFRHDLGYRVALLFKGGKTANHLTPDHARSVADQIRDGESDAQVIALAAAIDGVADDVESSNVIWERAGRPSGGLDSLNWGRA